VGLVHLLPLAQDSGARILLPHLLLVLDVCNLLEHLAELACLELELGPLGGMSGEHRMRSPSVVLILLPLSLQICSDSWRACQSEQLIYLFGSHMSRILLLECLSRLYILIGINRDAVDLCQVILVKIPNLLRILRAIVLNGERRHARV